MLAGGTALILLTTLGLGRSDPLPSWNEGPTQQDITAFVENVTKQHIDFVPPKKHIATFDHDSTFWVEQPMQNFTIQTQTTKKEKP